MKIEQKVKLNQINVRNSQKQYSAQRDGCCWNLFSFTGLVWLLLL